MARGVGTGWVRSGHCLLPSQHDAWGCGIRSLVTPPPQTLGCACACRAWVSHTAVVPLSILSLGKNVRHSSYSKQHPWCLVSWVRFTPQWSLAVNFHTSAVCLGSSPCFANWMESGKGSLPYTHREGAPSIIPLPASRTLGWGPGQGQRASVLHLSLSPSLSCEENAEAKISLITFWTNFEAKYVRRIGGVESAENNGVRRGGEAELRPAMLGIPSMRKYFSQH